MTTQIHGYQQFKVFFPKRKGGAIGKYGVEEWCIRGCGGETWRKEITWKI